MAGIGLDEAIAKVGDRLAGIVERHGPRAVAVYQGTFGQLDHPANHTMMRASMRALGSRMIYSTASIDQSGKLISDGLHGAWMAPSMAAHDPDVMLLIGNNPLVSHCSFVGSPGDLFADLTARSGSLIVIDPRRTETARRARLHLQPRPGHDPALLAAMLRIIFDEGLHDPEFLAEHATGVPELRWALEPFEPGAVAQAADVPIDDLVAAARLFGSAERAMAGAATGPSMSGNSTLLEYLVLCMQTVCGYWMREGETVRNAVSLLPSHTFAPRAQARPPTAATGSGNRAAFVGRARR